MRAASDTLTCEECGKRLPEDWKAGPYRWGCCLACTLARPPEEADS